MRRDGEGGGEEAEHGAYLRSARRLRGGEQRDATEDARFRSCCLIWTRQGELNATQTNEIIKLEAETQEHVLPLIADKTAKDTRRIVAAAS